MSAVWAPEHLCITVRDRPAPQGSMRTFRNGGMVSMSPYLKTWREAVKTAARDAMQGGAQEALQGPVSVEITITLPRPKGHYGTGRNAMVVKPSAPGWPTGTPDLDKLYRSCLDALTAAGVWQDDAQVVELTGRKVYVAAGVDALDVPGALIRVRPATTDQTGDYRQETDRG